MDFFKFEGGRESITLKELEDVCLSAKSPAELITLIDDAGINLGFAERLSFLWRKKFDGEIDEELLEQTVQKGFEVDLKFL